MESRWEKLSFKGGTKREVHRNDGGRGRRRTEVGAGAYRQAAGLQRGHAAPRGGPGLQHVLPRRFELPALGGHVAVPQGHQDGVFVAAVQPLFGFHGGLRPRRVRVQVVLEEVRLQGAVESRNYATFNQTCPIRLTFLGTVMVMGSHFLSSSLNNLKNEEEGGAISRNHF